MKKRFYIRGGENSPSHDGKIFIESFPDRVVLTKQTLVAGTDSGWMGIIFSPDEFEKLKTVLNGIVLE